MVKTFSIATATLRKQVSEAVLQGFLDSALAADLATAKTNGYQPDRLGSDSDIVNAPIAGNNR